MYERLGFLLLAAMLSSVSCATSGPSDSPLEPYSMPATAGAARPTSAADPASAAELAEGALALLAPERARGPDYLGAAQLCLLAAEVADPQSERTLALACLRLAVRSALKAGQRQTYLRAVDAWDAMASTHEGVAGELRLHLAIRDRLRGHVGTSGEVPSGIRDLITPAMGEVR